VTFPGCTLACMRVKHYYIEPHSPLQDAHSRVCVCAAHGQVQTWRTYVLCTSSSWAADSQHWGRALPDPRRLLLTLYSAADSQHAMLSSVLSSTSMVIVHTRSQ
jgi:hypothetical protein